MKEAELMEVDEYEEHIQQTSIKLSYFDYEIPVLYLQDQTPYIPIVALCEMLGLQARMHIPRWRKQVLWCNARKLPYQIPNKGRRMVWCLHAGALLFWFSCFDWSLVLPERRVQLQQVTDEGLKVLAQIHQKMLDRYESIRQHLFQFLTIYSDSETTLSRFSASLHMYLNDFDVCIAWEDLINQGKALINEATTHARNMLQDQVAGPVLDALEINSEGSVINEVPLPLFPIVQEEDITCFFKNLEKILQWHEQMVDFLGIYGIIWDGEWKKWYLAR